MFRWMFRDFCYRLLCLRTRDEGRLVPVVRWLNEVLVLLALSGNWSSRPSTV